MFINLLANFDSVTILSYIDPGLGSMQLQIVVAALLSATFYLKTSYSQAKGLISRFLKRSA